MERENADGDRKKAPWKVQNKILKILSTATNSALSHIWVSEVFRKNKKDLFLCYVMLCYRPCYRPYFL